MSLPNLEIPGSNPGLAVIAMELTVRKTSVSAHLYNRFRRCHFQIERSFLRSKAI